MPICRVLLFDGSEYAAAPIGRYETSSFYGERRKFKSYILNEYEVRSLAVLGVALALLP